MDLISKRKVQQFNHSRLISLPAIWCQSCDLDKGDFVEIIIKNDGSLSLRPLEKIPDEH